MTFEWSRESRSWDLIADTGELIGMTRQMDDGTWEAQMVAIFGGRQAFATDLPTIQSWMIQEGAIPR